MPGIKNVVFVNVFGLVRSFDGIVSIVLRDTCSLKFNRSDVAPKGAYDVRPVITNVVQDVVIFARPPGAQQGRQQSTQNGINPPPQIRQIIKKLNLF